MSFALQRDSAGREFGIGGRVRVPGNSGLQRTTPAIVIRLDGIPPAGGGTIAGAAERSSPLAVSTGVPADSPVITKRPTAMTARRRHFILGTLAWVAGLIAAVTIVRGQLSSTDHQPTDVLRDVSRWVLNERQQYRATAPRSVRLAVGDPVLAKTEDGNWRQVGVVRGTGEPHRRETWTSDITVMLYDEFTDGDADNVILEYHATPTSLDWVIRTILSQEKQQEIADLIAADWMVHQAEVIDRLQPVMRESLSRAIDAIESELPAVMRRHRADFARVGERYQADILQEQLIPLVRTEVLPVAVEEMRPLLTDIAETLWERVSLWQFTWRYLYDVSPLPERNRVQQEFERFVETVAIPELESRTEEFVDVAKRIVARVSRNDEVRGVIRRNLRTIAEDDELREIIWDVLRESVIRNEKLHDTLDQYWKSAETRAALKVASSSFEPTVRRIGDMVFGTRTGGVSPEFAKVLRLQILTKDRRWLLLKRVDGDRESPTAAALPIVIAADPMPFPIQFDARMQSPLSELTDPAAEGNTSDSSP